VQPLQSIFIGWIILLSRVPALYPENTTQIKIYPPFEHLRLSGVASHQTLCVSAILERPFKVKPATIIGFLLIILGIIGLATGGFSFTHHKKDVDVGPVQLSHESKQTIPFSPILSGIVLAAGLGLVVAGSRG
jgi:hypothetical protein